MKRAIAVAVLALAMTLASCGGDEGWADEDRAAFVAGCVDGGAPEAACECVQEKVEAAHPDLPDPTDLEQAEIVKFTKECVE